MNSLNPQGNTANVSYLIHSRKIAVFLHCAVSHYSATACLLPICQLHGVAVTTVEGIGSTKTRIHPVQVSSHMSTLLHNTAAKETVAYLC